jgi:multisubunit Na+/H+ antiporter MnhE subunit
VGTPVWRVVAGTVGWAVALALLFMLYVGESTTADWVAAGILGAVAAVLIAPLIRSRLFSSRIRLAWLRLVPSVFVNVFVDFWVVSVHLARCVVRRQTSSGAFVARSFQGGGPGRAGSAWRAFVSVMATWSPNSYVVDIDPEHGDRLSHDLVPRRASERPA